MPAQFSPLITMIRYIKLPQNSTNDPYKYILHQGQLIEKKKLQQKIYIFFSDKYTRFCSIIIIKRKNKYQFNYFVCMQKVHCCAVIKK